MCVNVSLQRFRGRVQTQSKVRFGSGQGRSRGRGGVQGMTCPEISFENKIWLVLIFLVQIRHVSKLDCSPEKNIVLPTVLMVALNSHIVLFQIYRN